MVKAMKLFAFLIAAAFFTAQPAVAASTPQMVPLEQQLAALASAQPTELGFAAYDLRLQFQHLHQLRSCFSDGQHGQDRGRGSLSVASRFRPPHAGRQDRQPVRPAT